VHGSEYLGGLQQSLGRDAAAMQAGAATVCFSTSATFWPAEAA